MRRVPAALAGVLLLVTTACGGAKAPAPTTAPSTGGPATAAASTASPTPDESGNTSAPTVAVDPEAVPPAGTGLRIYLVRDGLLGAATRPQQGDSSIARDALDDLVGGPSPTETGAGLTSAIPAGTTVNALTMVAGLATVDLSGQFGAPDATGGRLRVAQIVFTLTQVYSIRAVTFSIEGAAVTTVDGVDVANPVTRADFADVTPPILLDSPTPGQKVTSPLTVNGTTDAVDQVLTAQVLDSAGNVVTTATIESTSGDAGEGTDSSDATDVSDSSDAGGIVTSGTGTAPRGVFGATVPIPDDAAPGPATVVVFASSPAASGPPNGEVQIPVALD